MPTERMEPLEEDVMEPAMLDYEAPRLGSERPFPSRAVWFSLAGFCALAVLAGWATTSGQLESFSDVVFFVAMAAVGGVALREGLRSAG